MPWLHPEAQEEVAIRAPVSKVQTGGIGGEGSTKKGSEIGIDELWARRASLWIFETEPLCAAKRLSQSFPTAPTHGVHPRS